MSSQRMSRSTLIAGAWMVGLLTPACNPLRQPLGSLAPGGGSGSPGSAGSVGPTGSAGAAGSTRLTGNQIPSLPPEWEACDPSAFRCFRDPALPASPPVSAPFSGAPDPDPANRPVLV